MTDQLPAQAMTDQPKPTPTLKEEALAILAAAGGPDFPQQMTVLNTDQHILIRRALEALPQWPLATPITTLIRLSVPAS